MQGLRGRIPFVVFEEFSALETVVVAAVGEPEEADFGDTSGDKNVIY